jgi:hypothetical protein
MLMSLRKNLPLCLRIGRDYRGHTFSSDEKRGVVKWMKKEDLTPSKIASQWPSIKRKSLSRWRLQEAGGSAIHDSKRARPKLLDEEAVKEFDDGHDDKSNLMVLKVLFNKCASDTAIRSGKIISANLLSPVLALLESTTKPATPKQCFLRDREEKDPRNFFTWAILLLAYCAFLPAALVFNWDATTFSCGNDEHNRQKVYVKIERNNVDDKNIPPAVVGGGLGMYIKKYFFHNSAGQVAPPVYVVADDSTEPNTYRAFKLNGQQGGSIDFYKIMSACRGVVTPRMKLLMFNATDHVVGMMRERHQITEAEMDAAGIVNVNRPGTSPRRC